MSGNKERAFPRDVSVGATLQKGMTLRDYFAAKALQGMLAENGGGALGNDDLAMFAYKVADSMMNARND